MGNGVPGAVFKLILGSFTTKYFHHNQTGIVIVLHGILNNASHISIAFAFFRIDGKHDTLISTARVLLVESVRMSRPVIGAKFCSIPKYISVVLGWFVSHTE